jgi:hypothetical protein
VNGTQSALNVYAKRVSIAIKKYCEINGCELVDNDLVYYEFKNSNNEFHTVEVRDLLIKASNQ